MKTLPTPVLRLCALLLGLLVVAAAFSPPALASDVIHLTGTVTNTDGVNQNGSVYVKRVGANSASGTGLADGTFSWDWDTSQFPDGNYVIFVLSRTMDDTERYYVSGDPAGTTQENLATQVHLGPGAPDVTISMMMPAIAKVSGRVVDSANNGIAGATVILSEAGNIRPQVTTGADGVFHLGYVQAGSWQVTAVDPPAYLRSQVGVVVPASGSVLMPDVVLHRAGSITGQVTDSATGAPIPFLNVDMFSATSHQPMGTTTTDADGRYHLGQLGTDPFVLRFLDGAYDGYTWTLNDGGDPNDWSPQTPITLSEGEDRIHDQQLVAKTSPAPAHTLGGTVTDTLGTPLPGIEVTDGDVSDTTDRKGHWYLAATDGTHTLQFSQDWHWSSLFGSAPGWFPAYYPSAFAESAATPVTVSGGVGPDDLQTSLHRAGRISGTVEGPGGSDDVGAREIWAYDDAGHVVTHDPMLEQSSYTVDVPADLPVRLVARGLTSAEPQLDLMPRWFGDVDSPTVSTPVQVGPGLTSAGHDFHLVTGLVNLALPAISGTVASGHTLTATVGTWSVHTQTAFATTWLRDGVAVGSGPSYVLTPADAGRSLQVRVTATNGSTTATAVSAPAGVGLVPTTVAGRGTSPRAGRVKLAVVVSGAGVTPTGTVSVRRGSQVVKAGVALVGGRAVVVLRRQPAGVKRYTVAYAGSPQTAPSTVTVKVRVR